VATGDRTNRVHLQTFALSSARRDLRTDLANAAREYIHPSNIAEGRGRLSPMEFRHFLGLAQGSLFELKTQLVVAKRLEFGDCKALSDAESLTEEVSKMLTSFIHSNGWQWHEEAES
jgi:four helix bundle protein